MSEVGALIIKLQAETAQFRADMGKVKGDLNDLKGAASEGTAGFDQMGGGAGGLRTQIGLLDNAIRGAHAQAMADLIRRFSDSAIVMKLLPLAATGAAFVVVGELIAATVEKIEKFRTATRDLGFAQNDLNKTIGTVYTNLEDKLLQAGIKADELTGNHLDALRKELVLIDHQSLKELEQSFTQLAGAADKAFVQLQSHWYQFGSGSARAKHNLQEFQSQYELLLSTGKTDEANKLLQDRVKYEEQILSLEKEMRAAYSPQAFAMGDYLTKDAAKINELKKAGAGIADHDIQSQQDLVDILHAQVEAHKQIAQTAGIEKNTATTKDHLKGLTDESSLQRIVTAGVDAHAAALRKLAQTQAEMATAEDKGVHGESVDDKLAISLGAIDQEHEAAVQAADQILASKKNLYDADLKAAGQNVAKKKELEAQLANEVRAHDDTIAQADADAQKKALEVTAAAEAEKRRMIIASEQATADGVLAIRLESAKEQEKVEQEQAKDLLALHKINAEKQRNIDVLAVWDATAAEVKGYQDRIKALDKYAADYQKKVQELQNKIKETTKKGDDEVSQIKKAALQKQLTDIQQSEQRMYEAIASSVAKSIVMNQNLGQSIRVIGEQMAEGMIKNLIMMELTADKKKLIDAKSAFHNAMGEVPWPLNLVVAPAMFAATMAFEQGGKIPGEGAVPIIGHGGETVVTKALTDRVERAEGQSSGSRGDTHIHNTFAPQIHAVDGEGVDRMLKKHGTIFQRHIEGTLRKLNK